VSSLRKAPDWHEFHIILEAFAKLRKATISFVMSVCMGQLGSQWTDVDETWYLSFFENLSRKLNFYENPTRITGTLHGDVLIFMTISRYIVLRMRNVLEKVCRENQNTHVLFNNVSFENRAVYEIMSKNMVEPEGPQKTSQHGACTYE
jgi:hypothetical protein